MLERLKRSLLDCPVVKKGDYFYFVHPLTDGIPEVSPELLNEVASEMARLVPAGCGKIVTAEAMGISLAVALSLKTNIPFNVIRKRSYGLAGEVEVSQKTGYSTSKLYINGLKRGEKVIIVDDVLSTGGTLRASLAALRELGVDVLAVLIVVNKGGEDKRISGEFSLPVHSLVNVRMEAGRVVIEERRKQDEKSIIGEGGEGS